MVTTFNLYILAGLFFLSCFIYFIYFIFKLGDSLTFMSLVGMIFFHLFFWFSFILAILYALLKLYNSLIASLPIN
ncbi:DUF5366 family protein [Pseudomonas sp. 2995-1]|uniref:DUF5366 family protein n=1 Tax=Pseudomonas sp. 2995-1 TaxID=1712679 RepID=UPI0034D2375E